MKTKVVGEALVITSGFTMEDLREVEKYKPEALKLIKEDNGSREEVFAVCLVPNADTIGKYGANFGAATGENGLATITRCVSLDGVTDVKQYIADNLGAALANLDAIEVQVGAALEEVKAMKQKAMDSIEVL